MWRIRRDGSWLAGTDAGEGNPVVLLHGLASTHRWWDLVTARLTGVRVVRFDHRGHGESGAPQGVYHLECLASDTLAVLDDLDLDRVVLAGHSLGAAVALRVAAAHPQRVAALTFVDGGVYDSRLLFGTAWEQARTAMVLPRRGQVTAAVLQAWLASTDLPAAALAPILANYHETGPGGALQLRLARGHEEQLAHDLWQQDPVPLLAALTTPALLLAARQHNPGHDRPRWASIERAQAVTADLTVRWIDGGHDLPLQRPAEVADAIRALAYSFGSAEGCPNRTPP